MATTIPKGFIELVAMYHSDPTTGTPETLHLVNCAHIICVEKTKNNNTRIKLNGFWLECDLNFDQVKTLIKDAMA